MFLLKWYKEWIEIRASLTKPCESCETLKHQLELSNFEKKQMLDRLLEKPEPVHEAAPPQITRPISVPWRLRQQMLEAEDRAKAQALKNAAKPDAETEKKETAEFEQELKDATERREKQVTG